MPHSRQHLITAILLAGLSACAPSGPPALSDADKAAIQATSDAALAIGNTTPLDAPAYVKAYYADQAILMPPNEPAVSGAEAITAWFNALPPVSNLTFTVAEIEGTGNVAYVRGAYSLTITPPGAPAITDSGKYLEVWKKGADGSWRSARDIFNSDLPPAPAPAASKR